MFKTEENKEIYKAIHRSQHCQRNWDLSKEIPQEDLDLLVEAATQCPSKQNIAYYKAHFITNRDLIEKIHSHTDGFTINNYINPKTKKNSVTNSQVLANLLIVFETHRDPERVKGRNCETMAEQTELYKTDYDNNEVLRRDQDMAMGVAAGYVNVTAAMMGYSTGCCACFNPLEVQDLMGLDGMPRLLMGVGFKQEGTNRRIHHKNRGFQFPSLPKQPVPTFHWN